VSILSTRRVLLLFRDLFGSWLMMRWRKKRNVHQFLSEDELPNGDDRILAEVLE
jgi:hypothetical protein